MTTPVGQFGPIGFPELLIFALVMLLLFGHRLPGVMRSLGRGVIEFKKGLRGEQTESDANEGESEAERKMNSSDHEAGDGSPR